MRELSGELWAEELCCWKKSHVIILLSQLVFTYSIKNEQSQLVGSKKSAYM